MGKRKDAASNSMHLTPNMIQEKILIIFKNYVNFQKKRNNFCL